MESITGYNQHIGNIEADKGVTLEEKKGPKSITGVKEYWYCDCLQSAIWPECDGSHHHLGSGRGPEMVELDETKTYQICQCYKTKNRPFCDGSHKK